MKLVLDDQFHGVMPILDGCFCGQSKSCEDDHICVNGQCIPMRKSGRWISLITLKVSAVTSFLSRVDKASFNKGDKTAW